MNCKTINTTLALVISCGLTVVAQTPEFNIIKPSTTGVPGEEVRVMKFDPTGNLWIAGRFYFSFGAKVGWQCCRPINSITNHCLAAGSIRERGGFGRACIIRFPPFTSTTWYSAPVA